MSERAKMLASLRRDGVHDELRAKSKVEKKRRARQAEQQRKKKVQGDGEAAEAVGRLDAAVSVPALRARGSAPPHGADQARGGPPAGAAAGGGRGGAGEGPRGGRGVRPEAPGGPARERQRSRGRGRGPAGAAVPGPTCARA